MPEFYKIPNHYKGDTFNGLQFTVLNTVGLTAIDLTDVVIKSEFKLNNKRGQTVQTFIIDTGLTVTDALNGVFQIDPFILDWGISTYYYDIEFTFPNGRIITYIDGTIKIIQDVTNG
jgi:cytoplasmic iron level regulating protein YaaA (DUF328/UPF0246 family)